jgi:uncharacterized Rossmann fold enzyme
MNNENWDIIYKKIIKELNFDINKDIKSSKILDDIIKVKKKIKTDELYKLIRYKDIFIFGAGSSLNNSIKKYKHVFENKIKIAADGSTSALIKNNIHPEIIVTDLDGKIEDQINENKKGSIVIIHSHGNNINKIKKYVDKFNDNILGTTQVSHIFFENLYNFGGFTDGDRCIFLSEYFKVKRIFLIGFDFNGNVGEYSFTKNGNINLKIKKLKWCKRLIDILNAKYNNIYFL